MPTYKLSYFNVRGRAELIRFIFAYAGVEYEDFRIERQAWPAIKPTIPLGFVPALEVDGKIVTQTKAVGRYLAREFKLDGETSLDKAVADMVIDYFLDDIMKAALAVFFEKDEEKKAALKKTFYEEQLPSFFDHLEKVVKDNPTGSGYFVGKNLTWADLGLLNLADTLKSEKTAEELFGKHEKLKALYHRVAEHPRIAKWIASRPQTPM